VNCLKSAEINRRNTFVSEPKALPNFKLDAVAFIYARHPESERSYKLGTRGFEDTKRKYVSPLFMLRAQTKIYGRLQH
jgi:hypothetical protein